MAFTITGGKYALQTLASAGTNTVAINSAVPFVTADFSSIQRVAALFNAEGTTNYVTNGTFATDTAWTKGTGVTISGGVANCSNAALILSQNVALTVGNYYLVTLSYTRSVGANLRFANNTTDAGTYRQVISIAPLSGTVTFGFRAERNGFTIAADAASFTGTIDNVSIVDASTLKGIAYVRRATSTTVLELESAFFDPATGATVTQVTGDRLLVSKSWSECATAGWAVANGVSTISDTMTFGSPGIETSAFVYDEAKRLEATVGTSAVAAISLVGGIWLSGHCQDFAQQKYYGGCDYVTRASVSSMFMCCQDWGAHFICFGGQRYSTAGRIVWEPGNTATDRAKTIMWMGVDTANGILGPNGGGSPWPSGTESRMRFIECTSVVTAGNNICWRPSNSVVIGGGAKITGDVALSVFGSGYNNFAIGADSGKRFTVSDVRPGSFNAQATALWDQFFTTAATANFTNVWTPISTVIRWTTALVTFNWYWKGAYQNLQTGTRIQILKSDGVTTETSAVTSLPSTELTILSHTQSGANVQTLPVTYTNPSWTWAAWLYGFLPVSGSFAQQTVSLGTAGDTIDVTHGGILSQTSDVSITEADPAIVGAYASLSDLGQLYDRSIWWKTQSDTAMKWQGISNRNLVPSGSTITFGNSLVINSAAATAYSPNTATDVLTIKSSTLASTAKFSTLAASAISVAAATTVTCGLSGPVANAGTLNGHVTGNVTNSGTLAADCRVTGNVINTGTLASGVRVTGNLVQDTPTNLTGVTVTGNLTFNTNTNTTVTFTNCTISGAVSNSGTGIVTVNLSGSTITAGSNVFAQTPVTITNGTGGVFSALVWVYDSSNTFVSSSGWQSLVPGVTVNIPLGGSIRAFTQIFGGKPKITASSSTSASLAIVHLPETNINGAMNTSIRQTIANYFSTSAVSSQLYVDISDDMGNIPALDVLTGLHFFMVKNGSAIAESCLTNGYVIYDLINGGINVLDDRIKFRPGSNVDTALLNGLDFINFPLVLAYYGGVSTPVARNANDISVTSALWSKITAAVGIADMIAIADKVDASVVLAKKSHVQTVNDGVKKASLLIPHSTSI